MAQTLGILDVFWLGQPLTIKPDATMALGGRRNKAVVTARGVFRSQSNMASTVSIKGLMFAGTDTDALFGPDQEGELQVHCDTGQVYIFASAFVTDTVKINGGDNSEMSVEFAAGKPIVRVS